MVKNGNVDSAVLDAILSPTIPVKDKPTETDAINKN
jgi:hypothetical protein